MDLPRMHPQEIELRRGALAARVRPDVGGSVSAFWRVGQHGVTPILRAASAEDAHPLQMASFPLLPWCNRIEDGRFTWRERKVQLSPTDARDQYPLHGYGWKARWEVSALDTARVELRWSYPGGEWPWSFDAQQVIALEEHALTVDLRMTNTSREAAPAGLGHHPYFPLRPATRLLTNVKSKCETNAALIPTRLADVPGGQVFGERAHPYGHVLDNSFVGWREPAVIEQTDIGLRIEITAQPLHPVLAVFVPPTLDFFCVEPVQNTPNAFNQPDYGAPMHTLAPGETLRSMMVLTVKQ